MKHIRHSFVYLLLLSSVVEFIGVLLENIEMAKVASILGKTAFYMVAVIIIYTLYSGDKGIFIIGGLGLTGSLNVMFKTVLKMPRPPPSEWLIEAEGPGFPSGHAAMSFSFALLAGYTTRNPLIMLALLLHAFAVSGSRLVLHVHYPLDVIGGAVLGITMALVSIFLYTKINDPGKYLIAIAIPSFTASIISSIEMPDYTDAPLLTGLSMGALLSGLIILNTNKDYLYKGEWLLKFSSLMVGFMGLIITLILEKAGVYSIVLIAGFIFITLVLMSRLIVYKVIHR